MTKQINSIADLTPDPNNANRGTPRGHGVIEHSIRRHGAGRSGLAASDGTMIAGSQTLEEMAALGISIRPIHTDGSEWVVVIRDDVEAGSEQAKLMAVEDNRASELGLDWSSEVLDSLITDGIDLSSLFYEGELPIAAEEPPTPGAGGDEFDGTPQDGETRCQAGDLWIIGGVHRLVVGDCTDPAVVERLMQGEQIDCIFTSPPYDQQRTYEGNMPLDWRALVSGALLLATEHCVGDAQLFVNLGLVHRDGRVVRYWDDFIADMEDGQWPLFGWYVWDKLNGMPGDWNGRLAPAHEWVFHFCREALRPRKTVPSKRAGEKHSDTKTWRNPDGTVKSFTSNDPVSPFKIPDSVIRTVQHQARGIEIEHPAIFPIALPETFMHAYAGDLWYEPFCGSGTSIIAAHRTGMRCYGAEVSARYCDVILRRAEAEGLTCERDA